MFTDYSNLNFYYCLCSLVSYNSYYNSIKCSNKTHTQQPQLENFIIVFHRKNGKVKHITQRPIIIIEARNASNVL